MKRKRKKTWKKMEISKVKLNPEQAVLSCCDSAERAVVSGPISLQCMFTQGCGDSSATPSNVMSS
ncbi:MAG: hypothetical protein PHV17_07330 [Candidatus Omnitrophica bacterium]|nr:hypothetical protein [Candidatus Omnitrophota bacterium]